MIQVTGRAVVTLASALQDRQQINCDICWGIMVAITRPRARERAAGARFVPRSVAVASILLLLFPNAVNIFHTKGEYWVFSRLILRHNSAIQFPVTASLISSDVLPGKSLSF